LQRADTDDGGSIIEAEIHLAKRPKLFRQTEPALISTAPTGHVRGAYRRYEEAPASRGSRSLVVRESWAFCRF
ncbi:hypothetical protein, partial [Sinorhizobium medicae]|uniref:hypothetical protein n=1 Tax=Sinorhizobium medicae TaxID=110321 RepID=UPI001AED01FE